MGNTVQIARSQLSPDFLRCGAPDPREPMAPRVRDSPPFSHNAWHTINKFAPFRIVFYYGAALRSLTNACQKTCTPSHWLTHQLIAV